MENGVLNLKWVFEKILWEVMVVKQSFGLKTFL